MADLGHFNLDLGKVCATPPNKWNFRNSFGFPDLEKLVSTNQWHCGS